uniref:Uncharacterized protein n=1 Tax=viral metagenome TaxID=1070528 RepID=A0A6C0BWP2_9ZZZZ
MRFTAVTAGTRMAGARMSRAASRMTGARTTGARMAFASSSKHYIIYKEKNIFIILSLSKTYCIYS